MMVEVYWLRSCVLAALAANVGCGPTHPARPEAPQRTARATEPDDRASPPEATADAAVAAQPPTDAGTADTGLTPLDAAEFVMLAVQGFGDAVVSVPVGSTRPRAVLVAAHGNYDKPEWQCEVWRGLVGARAWVLCPRGYARGDSPSARDVRYTYRNAQSLTAELDGALTALKARFGAYVDPGAGVYTGFSLGANYGPSTATSAAMNFAFAVMIEGAYTQWTADRIRAFKERGGERVLYACGQAGCPRIAAQLAPRFAGAGVALTSAYAARAGHTYDGAVAEQIRGRLAWLFGNDARFAPE